ncbi:MAG: carboxypeptidase regulatory-like domain-containing protein [Bryobacterales bacterium]|nr:carboxypeptidase regulatory-like domain-containing protein [Bryobacterales bacterium]
MTLRQRHWLVCAAALILASPTLQAQEGRGQIFGRVMDPSNTPAAGVRLTVRNSDTNTTVHPQTNATGYYEANLLLPGTYEITAEMSGFKTVIRKGVGLAMGDHVEVNLKLEIGAVTESVSVTADSQLLETNAVSTGRTLENRLLMNMPVMGNNVILLAKLAPGVVASGVNNYVALHSVASGSGVGTATGTGGNYNQIDGMPNQGQGTQPGYLPYSDTVQELRVEGGNFDAAVGHTAANNVSFITRSGTNELHGSLTEQHWQQRWNGSPFFTKQNYYRSIAAAEAAGNTTLANYLRSQDKQPSGHSNNYAVAVGGPVFIPKIVNGKNKLFFFFSFNGFKDNKTDEPNKLNNTIPTLGERGGDFSDLLAVDPSRYQLYDPLSVRLDFKRPGHIIRDPMPGNIISPSRILNPMAKTFIGFLPTPNNSPAPNKDPLNNYYAAGQPSDWSYYALTNRVDYQLSSRHRFFGRWSVNDWNANADDWTYQSAPGLHDTAANRHNRGAMVDWVFTQNATTLWDLSVGFNEFRTGSHPTVPYSYKPSEVGLPSYMDTFAGDEHTIPYLLLGAYKPMGQPLYSMDNRFQTLMGKLDFSHVSGSHTLRAGWDSRDMRFNGGGGGNTSGWFSFDQTFTRRYDDNFDTPPGALGHPWAAFLLGVPTIWQVQKLESFALHTPAHAAYFNDNWRLTQKLTVNLGLRAEYELGMTERYNRMATGFDRTAKLPITDAAVAAYAMSPLPERPASSFNVLGGAIYPGTGNYPRALVKNQLMWMPRVAAAYRAASKTVIRGGYGIFYDSFNSLELTPNQAGYSQATTNLASVDFGLHWLSGDLPAGVPPLANPFPVRGDGTRFDTPYGNQIGNMISVGGGYNYYDYDNYRRQKIHRWQGGVQQQLSENMLLDISYMGSYGDDLTVDHPINALPQSYWATGLKRNQALASDMTKNVASPFIYPYFTGIQQSNPLLWKYMTTSTTYFMTPTIQKNALLRPYPQMGGITLKDPVGAAKVHQLNLRLDRRFSKGLQFTAGYSRTYTRSATVFINEFDASPTWYSTPGSARPHRLTAMGVYQLPFGKNQRFAHTGIWNLAFGGWQIALTYEYQPGDMLSWGNNFYYGSSYSEIGTGPRNLSEWFNTANFERVAANGPAAYHSRIFPMYLDALRTDSTNQVNANIQREFRIKERLGVQLRLDALNLQNRSQFAAPASDPYSTNFGQIVSQTQATNRFIQIQGRIVF